MGLFNLLFKKPITQTKGYFQNARWIYTEYTRIIVWVI